MTAAAVQGTRRIPKNSIDLQFAGDLVLVKSPGRDMAGLFRRYEALFESLANMDRSERFLNYCFINGLILTSHAKKVGEQKEKKLLFDLKNAIYLKIANDRDLRRKVAFRYLNSKNFRVTEFCDDCKKRNSEQDLPRHNWKFCKDCKVDRDFFNVLSMHHKFDDGSATLFLSNDLISRVRAAPLKKRGKLEDVKEEAVFQRYHYNARNLDAFVLDKVITWTNKLLNH